MSNLTLLRREGDKSNLGKYLNITVENNPYVSNPVNNALSIIDYLLLTQEMKKNFSNC